MFVAIIYFSVTDIIAAKPPFDHFMRTFEQCWLKTQSFSAFQLMFKARIFSFFLLCVFSLNHVSAASWYVDNQAAGLNNGINWQNAFNAWSNINWKMIATGDTVFVSGGTTSKTYHESFFIGTPPWGGAKGITLRTGQDTNHSGKVICNGIRIMYGANNSIIDGTFAHGTNINLISLGPITIYDSTNVVLRSVEVDRSSSYLTDTNPVHGIGISYKVDRITVDHCFIHETSGDGINIQQRLPYDFHENDYSHFIVTNCSIINVGDDGIQAYVPNVTIVNCTIDKAGFPTMFDGHPDGIEGPAHAGNLWLCGNRIQNFNQNIFLSNLSGNMIVLNNILAKTLPVRSGTDRGVYISPSLIISNNTTSVVIANNLFYGFNTYIAMLLLKWPSSDNIVVDNNIFMNCREYYAVSSSWNGTNNIFFSDPSFGYYNSGATTVCPTSVPAWAGLYENPLLIDPLHGNFQPTTNSPCIDTGTTLDRSLALDIRGLPRPQGKGWDVGPYEFGVFPASVRLKQP